MARRIATVSGYALRPGVSRNGRLYTPELIAGAVERAQARLGTGGLHLVDRTERVLDQRTHHAADDDSTRIVGRITKLTLEQDGSARFEADLADTPHGRTIASLIAPKGDGPDEVEPFLTGVSIRGAWRGQVRRQQHEGRAVETADGLDLDGLDYTGRPGVDGAVVDGFTPAASRPNPAEAAADSGTGRVLIFESVQEASVTTLIEEAAAPAAGGEPYGDVVYADNGYQKDKKKRYPLDTKARAKSAWSYINQADNARLYTSAQLKRVKARIVKALKGFGVTVATQERWLIEPAAAVTEALAECWGMDTERPGGDLYLSLTNGPTTVTVSSRLLDPHDLDAVGRAAMAGACNALASLDPDMDADIDVSGAEPEDDDQDADSMPGTACPCGCGCAIPDPTASGPGCPCRCGCMTCHATAAAFGTPESTPPAVAGQPLLPEHLAALESSGALERPQPGTYVTAAAVNEALATQTPAPDPAAETTSQEKEPAMAESTPTPAAETPGADDGIAVLSAKFDQLTDSLNGFVTALTARPQESAPAAAAPVAEQAGEPAQVAETEDQRISRLVAEGIAAALPKAVQAAVEETGGPARKGVVVPVTEATAANGSALPEGWPAKPLHQYSTEEWRTYVAPNTVGAILGARGEIPEQ